MRQRSVALSVTLTFLAGPALAAGLELVSRAVLEGDVVQGVSGIEVSADGSHFDAVSDAGWRYKGRLVRRGGTLEAAILQEVQPILGIDGLPVAARRVRDWSDAEGLAVAPDGTSWISFERWSRVQRFDPGDPQGHWIKDHPAFLDQRDNRQLEAVAVAPDGRILAFPERPTAEGFPIFVLKEDGWEIGGHIVEQNGFSIVGADFSDDGTLWLLERKLLLGLWWQNRVRRLNVDEPADAEIIWTGELDEFYNLEGIAVWEGFDGLRLLCVTDNNARQGVPTELVEFRLTE